MHGDSRKFLQSALSASDAQWVDWHWQQSHAVRDTESLARLFPSLGSTIRARIDANCRRVRFQLTPYMLSLVRQEPAGVPDLEGPVGKLYVPAYDPPDEHQPLASLLADNWDLPEDMVNPILQHKYENRVNFRIQNRCLAYCAYCFEAKRVLDRDSKVGGFREDLFQESLEYIRNSEKVHEVVLSGGEPLTLSNDRLDAILRAIRSIPQIRALRIQTRAFTQNPFRVDEGFIRLLKEYDVSALGVHVTHPVELTSEFRAALDRITNAGCRTLFLGQIPLLKDINDSAQVLEELFMALYALRVKPYYLLHAMPETLGAERYRTSVRRGVELMLRFKRRISNPALPEYVIVHAKGKHTVPLEPQGTPEFQYLPSGRICFRNWKGEWCEYLDVRET